MRRNQSEILPVCLFLCTISRSSFNLQDSSKKARETSQCITRYEICITEYDSRSSCKRYIFGLLRVCRWRNIPQICKTHVSRVDLGWFWGLRVTLKNLTGAEQNWMRTMSLMIHNYPSISTCLVSGITGNLQEVIMDHHGPSWSHYGSSGNHQGVNRSHQGSSTVIMES